MSEKQAGQKTTRESKWYYSHLNKFIREKIESKKIDTGTLSDILSVSEEAVRQWKIGYSRPDIDKLPRIAELFDVSIEYLLLGLPEFESRDLNIQAICKYTGLAPDTVKVLHSYKHEHPVFTKKFYKDILRFLDILIVHGNPATIFRPLLDAFSAPFDGLYELKDSKSDTVYLVSMFDVHMQFFTRSFDKLRVKLKGFEPEKKEVSDDGKRKKQK